VENPRLKPVSAWRRLQTVGGPYLAIAIGRELFLMRQDFQWPSSISTPTANFLFNQNYFRTHIRKVGDKSKTKNLLAKQVIAEEWWLIHELLVYSVIL
jgi:hypothetical protein